MLSSGPRVQPFDYTYRLHYHCLFISLPLPLNHRCEELWSWYQLSFWYQLSVSVWCLWPFVLLLFCFVFLRMAIIIPLSYMPLMWPGCSPIKRWGLSIYPAESGQVLQMLWPEAWGRGDAAPILGTALLGPSSFHFLSLRMVVPKTRPPGTHPPHSEQPTKHGDVTQVNSQPSVSHLRYSVQLSPIDDHMKDTKQEPHSWGNTQNHMRIKWCFNLLCLGLVC